jgi:DNA-binding CsgD family transcriptional regulator
MWEPDCRFEVPKLVRHRFDSTWRSLPQLTVLSTLLGWGRSTWIEQCDTYLRAHDPSLELEWAYTRAQLKVLLTRDSTTPRVVFGDALLSAADDVLWRDIVDALEERPNIRLVLSSVDVPLHSVLGDLDYRVFTERDLAFTPAEVSELVTLATGIEQEALAVMLADGLRGQIELIARRLRTHLQRGGQRGWSNADSSPEVHALNLIRRQPSVSLPRLSKVWLVLQKAKELRSFSVGQLRTHVDDPEVLEGLNLHEVFERFRNFPFFSLAVDAESGDEVLLWHHTAWQQIAWDASPEERHEHLERALATMQVSGGLVALLLGRLEEADEMISSNLQYLMTSLDPVTVETIGEADVDPAAYPALAVLQAEVRLRSGLRESTLRDALEVAFTALRARTTTTPEEGLARAAMLAFASSIIGDRSRVRRYLDYADELANAMPRSRPDVLPRMQRSRAAEHHRMLMRASLQLDDVPRGLRTIRRGVRFSHPADSGHVSRLRYVEGLEDLLGMRSLAGSVSPNLDGVFDLAVSFRFLEEGDDHSALDFLSPVRNIQLPLGSHSLADAHILLVRALAAPHELSGRDVTHPIEASVNLWNDGVPSTNVVFAAMVASASRGRTSEAEALIPLVAEERDGYAWLTRFIWAQWNGDFVGSLQEPAPPEFDRMPRYFVLAHVLHAASQLKLEQPHFAVEQLLETWRAVDAPRLFRFSLRFVPPEVYAEIAALADELPPGLAAAIHDARGDSRHIAWKSTLALSPSEAEVVALLGRGLKNQEIADVRHVTLGTVRTQLKSIYRKLGVNDRAGALAEARGRGLIEPSGELSAS